jgi:hypothetical protein
MTRGRKIFNIVYIIVFTLAIIVCIKDYIQRPMFMLLLIIAWLVIDTIKTIIDLIRNR